MRGGEPVSPPQVVTQPTTAQPNARQEAPNPSRTVDSTTENEMTKSGLHVCPTKNDKIRTPCESHQRQPYKKTFIVKRRSNTTNAHQRDKMLNVKNNTISKPSTQENSPNVPPMTTSRVQGKHQGSTDMHIESIVRCPTIHITRKTLWTRERHVSQ